MSDARPKNEFERISDDVAATRAQLFDTLDAIEDKLNVPKQVGVAAGKVRDGFDKHPRRYLAAFAGGAVVVGGIVMSVLRRR